MQRIKNGTVVVKASSEKDLYKKIGIVAMEIGIVTMVTTNKNKINIMILYLINNYLICA